MIYVCIHGKAPADAARLMSALLRPGAPLGRSPTYRI